MLKTVEGDTCQKMKKKRNDRAGALTNWKWQREGLVRTRKEVDQVRGTHDLETGEGETCWDVERHRPREGHRDSLPRRRGTDSSRHGKESTKRGHPPTGDSKGGEGVLRTPKEIDRATDTHSLVTTEGGTCQDMEKPRRRGGNSPTENGRDGLVKTRKELETDRARGHSLPVRQR